MKRFFLFLGLLLAVSLTLPREASSQIKYGGGVFYGTYLGNLGLNLRAEMNITEDLALVPKIDVSLPNFHSGTFLNGVTVHGHYYIEAVEGLKVYPIAGLTLKSYLDFDRYGINRVYHGFAINPSGGAGGIFQLDEGFSVFAELRYEIGRYHQFMSTAGVLFTPGN